MLQLSVIRMTKNGKYYLLNPNFANESETNNLIFLMSIEWKMFAVFVHELWQKRKNIEYV